ncbi:hypothetical protein B0H10DRAFT_2189744 [Mycena sp. CBHHK59/15]|nr:hypothetical protein B0H10DRAFT_2189744 [Mycena sp. CBHHK59/15]
MDPQGRLVVDATTTMVIPTPPDLLVLLAVYKDLEDIPSASSALALIVEAFLDAEPPLDPLYTHVEACKQLLTRRSELHETLKLAHVSKEYAGVRNSPFLHRQDTSADVAKLLSELRPHLVDFIQKPDPLKFWAPRDATIDADFMDHVRGLKIPACPGPSLLLHNLGKFEEDPVLKDRLNNIFTKGKHTVLMNTSGSGKTRLSFEGLCQHWGFYFTSALEGNPGSCDMFCVINDYLPSQNSGFRQFLPSPSSHTFSEDFQKNVAVAHRLFRAVLLARLLVLEMFSELIHAIGVSAYHKRSWLILQLLPGSMVSLDIFAFLLMKLRRTDDGHNRDNIDRLSHSLRRMYGEDFHLFCVIDEAQVAARQLEDAFQENGQKYPILREIMSCIEAHFPLHELSFLVAGIQVPKHSVQTKDNAARLRWCSDTGGFDDEQVQRNYVLRYLPPSFATSDSGDFFLKRLWQWCRGRHRVTATMMEVQMRDAFRSPHTLFSDYVQEFTGFRPKDALELSRTEHWKRERPQMPFSPMGCYMLDKSLDLQSVVLDELYRSVVGFRQPAVFGPDKMEAVFEGFGRFTDSSMTRIVVDEPLMLLTAAQQFFRQPVPSEAVRDPPYNYSTALHQYPPRNSTTLAKILVLYLTRVFNEPRVLSKVFSFSWSPLPRWANQKAELVELYHTDGQYKERPGVKYVDRPSSSALATGADTLAAVSAWLDDADGAPFCLLSGANADLIFVLKLADGTFVRIVLHASRTSDVLAASALRKSYPKDPASLDRVIDSLQPPLNRTSQSTAPRMLRVVASFPAKTYLKTATNKSSRGIASLNSNLLTQLTTLIPAPEILDQMVASITRDKNLSLTPSATHDRKRRKIHVV